MKHSFFKNLSEEIMSKKEENRSSGKRILSEIALPVKPAPVLYLDWKTVEMTRRLVKTYTFLDRKRLRYFVNELLEYEDSVNHHAEIMIDHDNVTVEVFTKDLNCLTELDYEYAKMADAIHQDVEHYR